jgi:hypothetical protein
VNVARHDADFAFAWVITPGQFGPIMRTPASSSFTFTVSISSVGMPSVMVIIS